MHRNMALVRISLGIFPADCRPSNALRSLGTIDFADTAQTRYRTILQALVIACVRIVDSVIDDHGEPLHAEILVAQPRARANAWRGRQESEAEIHRKGGEKTGGGGCRPPNQAARSMIDIDRHFRGGPDFFGGGLWKFLSTTAAPVHE
jgi:hypothetical protein